MFKKLFLFATILFICGHEKLFAQKTLLDKTSSFKNKEITKEFDMLFADHIEYNDNKLILTGNAYVSYGIYQISSDLLIYDSKTNIITAQGNVIVFDNKQQTINASKIITNKDQSKLIADDIIYATGDQGTLVAAKLIKQNNNINNLSLAKYTRCKLCDINGNKKTPTWSIQGTEIQQNNSDQQLYINNAVFKIANIPIMYLPFLQIANPSVKYKTGFLTPSLLNSSRVGTSIEVPYYVNFSHYNDLVISPRFFTKNNILLNVNYRHNYRSGNLNLDISFKSDKPSPLYEQNRWYTKIQSTFSLHDDLSLDININRVSDKSFIYQYGLLEKNENRIENRFVNQLNSNIELSWKNIIKFQLISVQDLREGNIDDYSPSLIPLLSGDYKKELFGGVLSLNAHLSSFKRHKGYDFSQFYGNIKWQKKIIHKNGLVSKNFYQFLYGKYNVTNLSDRDETCITNINLCLFSDYITANVNSISQEIATHRIGTELSYPLQKLTKNFTFSITPKLMPVLQFGDKSRAHELLARDSGIVLQYGNLFQLDNHSSFGGWHNKNYLATGIEFNIKNNTGWNSSLYLGKQFFAKETSLSAITQLPSLPSDDNTKVKNSDNFATFTLSTPLNITVNSSFRLDDDFLLRGNNSYLNFSYPLGSINLHYTQTPINQFQNDKITLFENKELSGKVSAYLSHNWNLSIWHHHDVDKNKLISNVISLIYLDECSKFEFGLRRDNTRFQANKDDISFFFRYEFIGQKN